MLNIAGVLEFYHVIQQLKTIKKASPQPLSPEASGGEGL